MSTLKYADELLATAKHMTAPGKGLLAADESTGTIKKRFDDIGVENTEANRQAYRQLLFTTPNIGDYISGAILFDETIRQSSTDGKKFVDMLNAAGVLPGIKLDQGMVDLDNYPGDKCTQGLDNLGKRAAEYYALGARFAKWRAVYHITDSIPSNFCYKAQAYGLARYAAICQANGLVPIVEPEVIMDGSHSIERSYEVTYTAQAELFKALNDHMVDLERIILKPNMVIPGYENGAASKETVAEWTLKCLRNTTPPSVPGIMFLSGGQSELDSTVNLDAMNKSSVLKPWALSFSYGRALQASALKAWGGKPENVAAGQAAFTKRAVANFHAAKGTWTDELEK